jgi:hypothetical protein
VRVVEVRLVAGERDDLSVAFGCLVVVAFGLVEPTKTFVAVMHAGEAASTSWAACSASSNFLASMRASTALAATSSCPLQSSHRCGSCCAAAVAVVAAALAAASFSREAASSRAMQQRLYFLPLPQGQRSFRPILAISPTSVQRTEPLYQTVLADAKFHEQLLVFDRDLSVTARAAGCHLCGGALHSAPFGRKPRGGPAGLGQDYAQRFSSVVRRTAAASGRRRHRCGFSGARSTWPRS